MTRVEALTALIARVEAASSRIACIEAHHLSASVLGPEDYAAFGRALDGSLDAVARLEAPLRARGWGLSLYSPEHSDGQWVAIRTNARLPRDGDGYEVMARAWEGTEPRARLLAVLRALHHEATAQEPAHG